MIQQHTRPKPRLQNGANQFPSTVITRGQECLALPVQQKLLSHDNVKCTFYKNPCPCGYAGDSERQCICSAAVVTRYQKRLSGPLLDRIDIHVDMYHASTTISSRLRGRASLPVPCASVSPPHAYFKPSASRARGC